MTPREFVLSWVDAFNRADVDALADFYAEDAVNHQVAEAPREETSSRFYVNRGCPCRWIEAPPACW